MVDSYSLVDLDSGKVKEKGFKNYQAYSRISWAIYFEDRVFEVKFIIASKGAIAAGVMEFNLSVTKIIRMEFQIMILLLDSTILALSLI